MALGGKGHSGGDAPDRLLGTASYPRTAALCCVPTRGARLLAASFHSYAVPERDMIPRIRPVIVFV